ncbi:MAG: PAS domain S-box protein, partial [Bacteroidota bacterium]
AHGRHIKDEEGNYNRMAGIVQDITTKKAKDLEIQYREELLANIIKHNPGGVAIHDKELNYLFVSDKYLKDYKIKDHNIIGKHHYEVFPNLPEKWRKVHQKVLKGMVLSNDEDIFQREDGTIEYTRWLCKPWYTKEGEIGGMILYTDLITDRKLIELEYRETARKLKLVLEHAGDGIFSVDASDRATMINEAALRMLGYRKNELLGKQIHPVHHHTQKDGTPYPVEKCPIHQVFRDGKINSQTDEVFWRKDGSSFPVEYMSAPIRENGKITGVVVSFRDITSRKIAEEKIQKLNSQLLQIINIINQISKAGNTELLQLIVAKAARKLVNAKGTTFVIRDEGFCHYVEENTDSKLWKGKKFPLEKCITGWVMLNKQPAIVEDIYQDERIPTELYEKTFVKSLAVFPANEKDPKFVIGCYWEKKYSPNEEEIRFMKTLAEAANIGYESIQLLKNLEARVKERTIELERVNHELESFSYSVSHDLRAPLRAINGFVNILMEELGSDLSTERNRLCKIIKDNTQKMDKLINDLLTFSRLTRKEINMSCIDMQKLVKSIYFDITSETDRNRINFTVRHLERGYGDPNLIKQVVTNILSNALKYSSKKEKAEVEIFCENHGSQIYYYFKDNGAGFDMRYKDKLFGVFQRLHTDADFEGNGIGLATVQRIIHRHGGIIDAKSEPGKGAMFWFSLPGEK